MQESLNGNAFTLSREDKLYAALLYLKTQVGAEFQNEKQANQITQEGNQSHLDLNR
jgi:hypothetical protein